MGFRRRKRSHRIFRFFTGLVIVGWAVRVLDPVGLFQPVLSLGRAIVGPDTELGNGVQLHK